MNTKLFLSAALCVAGAFAVALPAAAAEPLHYSCKASRPAGEDVEFAQDFTATIDFDGMKVKADFPGWDGGKHVEFVIGQISHGRVVAQWVGPQGGMPNGPEMDIKFDTSNGNFSFGSYTRVNGKRHSEKQRGFCVNPDAPPAPPPPAAQ